MFRIWKLKFGIYLLFGICFLVLSLFVSSEANAGTIIKAPAYLGLNQGLVGCWTFDGIYTKAPDCSGNNNTGTLTNGPTKVRGKVGQAIDFDGVDDYVVAAPLSSSVYGANPRTISFWFKADAFDTATGDRMISLAKSGGAGAQFKIYAEDNGISIAFNFERVGYAANTLSTGRWYHAVIVVPVGATLTSDVLGYIDGVSYPQISGTPQTLNTTSSNNLTFGAEDTESEPFGGSIDEVRIYNRALSITEIQRLYLIGLGSKENRSIATGGGDPLFKGLVGCWSFDGIYTKAPDCSGNNNTGTLTNGPTKVRGKVGQALNFDGVDDYVDAGDPSSGVLDFGTATNFTISMWAKVSGTSALISKVNQAITAGFGVRLHNNSDKLTADIRDGTNNLCKITTAANGPAFSYYRKWTHIVVVFIRNGSCTNSDMLFYVDGANILGTNDTATVNMNTNISNSQPLRIGTSFASGALNTLTAGSIDEVRVYNRVLSSEEVRRIYNQSQSKFNSPQTDSLTHGLVGCWTLDGLYTKAPDCSGNNNTGVLTGATKIRGKVGQALDFHLDTDPIDEDVNMGTVLNNMTNMTISAWIYPRTEGENSRGVIVAKGTGVPSSGWLWRFSAGGTNALAFELACNGDSLARSQTNGSINLNQWQHVVLIGDGSCTAANWRMYVNGVESSYENTINATSPKSDDSTNSLRIGNQDNGANQFHGRIDEVRVYNRILSAGEIQKLYNMGR